MPTDTVRTARKFWRTLEAIHTVVYFAPDAGARYKDIGLRGYWSGYFASRSAPLGTPSAELVTATFFGFAPRMVAKAIPDAWARADRDVILATREGIASHALEPILAGQDVGTVADALLEVAAGLNCAGRPLAAAHKSLPTPQSPIARLWHAASVLREYRGDGHLAVLTAAGVDPIEANIVQVSIGKAGADQQLLRGWSDAEWAGGRDRLAARGWLNPDGTITDAGRAEREAIEVSTDATSDGAIRHLIGTPVADSLLACARAVVAHGPIPFPNATGVTTP